ncbi:DUF1822 family protein [uncultured Nostoc sp.]|uniref:DUF1822 family protein n=1 Tax=uncultured Nostoc sp. TaxID=340711 RepID=UPI0035C95937
MNENNLAGNNNMGFIEIPLGTEAHRYAKEFAAEQRNPQKGKQVYLNTLAVYAVHRYLDWINIETDLNQSDSWQSGTRMLFDVADLVLPSIGKLECRPVLPDEEILYLPEEIRRDRIGYVAVQFAQELDQAKLLGFIPGEYIIDSSEEMRLDKLHSLNDLIGHLADQTEPEKLVALREWLERNYPPDWFSPADLILATAFKRLNPAALQPSAIRAKEINLGGQLANRSLALAVRLTPISTEDIEVQVYLYPTSKSSYTDLPPDVQLIVVDEKGSDFMHAQTRRFDESLCLPFSGKTGEKFGVKIVFNNTCISENFVI